MPIAQRAGIPLSNSLRLIDMNLKKVDRIRSFVLRAGRTTGGQQRAIEVLGPQFLIPFQENLLNLEQAFSGSTNPKILEIGFGMGETTASPMPKPISKILGLVEPLNACSKSVSYTHLTLPTNREV